MGCMTAANVVYQGCSVEMVELAFLRAGLRQGGPPAANNGVECLSIAIENMIMGTIFVFDVEDDNREAI